MRNIKSSTADWLAKCAIISECGQIHNYSTIWRFSEILEVIEI